MTYLASGASQPPSSPPTVPGGGTLTDEALLAQVQAMGEGKPPKSSSSGVLLITAVVFVAAGGLSWGWRAVVFLLVAIALHELGHVCAMRLFGYKNVRMLFVPLFGGLATGQPRELDATRNALVAMAGPLVGLLTALVATALGAFFPEATWLAEYAWLAWGLNAINLLPFMPLDGGQITNDALFSRHPVLELIFRIVAIVGLCALAYVMEAWLLFALPAFMLLTLSITFRRARIIREARRDPAWQQRELDLDAVGLLRDLVRRVFHGLAPAKYENSLAMHVHGMWMELRKRFPGPGATVGLVAGYLALLLIIVPAVAVFITTIFGTPGL